MISGVLPGLARKGKRKSGRAGIMPLLLPGSNRRTGSVASLVHDPADIGARLPCAAPVAPVGRARASHYPVEARAFETVLAEKILLEPALMETA
jgi:hypothetical protein